MVLPLGGLTNRSTRKRESLRYSKRLSQPPFLLWVVNMRHSVRNSVFSTSPFAEATPACLAGWHSRWLEGCLVPPDSSTFLRSLRSIPITGLRRYYGRSDSCEAGSSAPVFGQPERRFSPPQVSLIHASGPPIIPSPTPWGSRHRFRTLPLRVSGFPLAWVGASPFSSRPASFQAESSSLSYGLIVHLLLLPTPPRGDAVAAGYRPERACLKRTSTSLAKRAFGRTGAGAPRTLSGTRDGDSGPTPAFHLCDYTRSTESNVFRDRN
jgi:hypothetical protein